MLCSCIRHLSPKICLLFIFSFRIGLSSVHAIQAPSLVFDFKGSALAGTTADGVAGPALLTGKAPSFAEGVGGNQAIFLDGDQLRLPLKQDYFNINEGTAVFWVRPKNWSDGKLFPGSSGLRLVPLMAVGPPGGNGWTQFLYLAINQANGSTLLSYRSLLTEPEQRQIYLQEPLPAGSVPAGEWTMIAVTWSNMELMAYLNGKLIGSASYGLPIDKALSPAWSLWLLPDPWWDVDYEYQTEVSDIRLFTSALNANQVASMYQSVAGTGRALRNCRTTAPLASAPVVDGTLAKEEWADASSAPLMRGNGDGMLQTEYPGMFFLKHDGQNLYVAGRFSAGEIKTPGADGMSDEAVFSGTHFAVAWRPAGVPENQCYQVAMAPNGSLFVVAPEGSSEPPVVPEFKSMRTDAGWDIEAKLPLAGTGLTPGRLADMQFILHRPEISNFHNQWVMWNVDKPAKMFWANMGEVQLRTDAQAFVVGLPEGLTFGQGRITARVQPAPPGSVKISISSSTRTEAESTSGDEALSFRLPPNAYNLEVVGVNGEQEVGAYGAAFIVRDPLQAAFQVFPSSGEIEIKVDARGLAERLAPSMEKGEMTVEAELVEVAAGAIVSQENWPMKSWHSEFVLPFTDPPPGDYIVRVRVKAPAESFVKDMTLVRPSDEFLRDRKGLERTIPSPYKPLVVSQTGDDGEFTVSTPFITYRFGEGAFPLGATVRGIEVISGEPKLRVKTAGEEHDFQPVSRQALESTDQDVSDSGVMECSAAGLALEWHRRMHYDGLIRYDLKLLPKGEAPVTIEGLSLSVQVPADAARYSLSPIYHPDWDAKNRLDVFPTAWLTGDRAGFNLFTDNDANWVYPENEKPIKLRRSADGSATIEAVLIDSPVTLNPGPPATYVLGMTATPTKPPRSDWRALHEGGWGNLHGQNLAIIGWGGMPKWIFKRIQYFAAPIADNFRYWADQLANRPARVTKLFPYGFLTAMPDNNPISDYYGTEWLYTRDGFSPPKIERYTDKIDGQPFYFGVPRCLNKEGYRDYIAYYADQYLREHPFIIGPYFDGSGVDRTDTPYCDTSLVDVFRPGRNVYNDFHFGMRDIYERLYKITKKHRGDDGIVYAHAWSDYRPSIAAFMDMTLPGEEFMHTIKNGLQVYTEAPLEQWQSNYSANIYGTAVQFMTQHRNYGGDLSLLPPDKREEYTRPPLTMCLIHDVPLAGWWYVDVEKTWAALDRNRVREADFRGYWQQNDIQTDSPSVKASYYFWPDSDDRLLLLGNIGAEPESVRLSGVAEFSGKDEIAGTLLDLSASIDLPAYGFRIVRLSRIKPTK